MIRPIYLANAIAFCNCIPRIVTPIIPYYYGGDGIGGDNLDEYDISISTDRIGEPAEAGEQKIVLNIFGLIDYVDQTIHEGSGTNLTINKSVGTAVQIDLFNIDDSFYIFEEIENALGDKIFTDATSSWTQDSGIDTRYLKTFGVNVAIPNIKVIYMDTVYVDQLIFSASSETTGGLKFLPLQCPVPQVAKAVYGGTAIYIPASDQNVLQYFHSFGSQTINIKAQTSSATPNVLFNGMFTEVNQLLEIPRDAQTIDFNSYNSDIDHKILSDVEVDQFINLIDWQRINGVIFSSLVVTIAHFDEADILSTTIVPLANLRTAGITVTFTV